MREKTNSITHLVKIVAQETIKEMLCAPDHSITRIRTLEKKVAALESNKPENAGDFWNGFERQNLEYQLATFVKRASTCHGRTEDAIWARLKEMLR